MVSNSKINAVFPSDQMKVVEHKTQVLVVGAGPAGLLLAFQLAKHGVKCVLTERNTDTTQWPKMTLHNARTMELLKRLGLDEGVRSAGMS